jgi:flagellar basal body-associated protein FliL
LCIETEQGVFTLSIEKDVEKMYMKDMEKQNRNKKKKKKKKVVTLILVIVIIAAVLLLMRYLGIGFGGGKGSGSSGSDSGAVSQSESVVTTVTTETPKEPVNVQVSGSAYIYNGNVITLDALYENLRLMDNIVVVIKDDNATKNAMDELTNMLETNGKAYTIEEPEDSQTDSSESAADSAE